MLNSSRTTTLNVEVLQESGYVSVEVLSEDSWRVQDFSRENFVNITNSGLDSSLRWRDREMVLVMVKCDRSASWVKASTGSESTYSMRDSTHSTSVIAVIISL